MLRNDEGKGGGLSDPPPPQEHFSPWVGGRGAAGVGKGWTVFPHLQGPPKPWLGVKLGMGKAEWWTLTHFPPRGTFSLGGGSSDAHLPTPSPCIRGVFPPRVGEGWDWLSGAGVQRLSEQLIFPSSPLNTLYDYMYRLSNRASCFLFICCSLFLSSSLSLFLLPTFSNLYKNCISEWTKHLHLITSLHYFNPNYHEGLMLRAIFFKETKYFFYIKTPIVSWKNTLLIRTQTFFFIWIRIWDSNY